MGVAFGKTVEKLMAHSLSLSNDLLGNGMTIPALLFFIQVLSINDHVGTRSAISSLMHKTPF